VAGKDFSLPLEMTGCGVERFLPPVEMTEWGVEKISPSGRNDKLRVEMTSYGSK